MEIGAGGGRGTEVRIPKRQISSHLGVCPRADFIFFHSTNEIKQDISRNSQTSSKVIKVTVSVGQVQVGPVYDSPGGADQVAFVFAHDRSSTSCFHTCMRLYPFRLLF